MWGEKFESIAGIDGKPRVWPLGGLAELLQSVREFTEREDHVGGRSLGLFRYRKLGSGFVGVGGRDRWLAIIRLPCLEIGLDSVEAGRQFRRYIPIRRLQRV